MTPKQIERIETKIKRIRATLTAERRKFGGYHDSGGLRYAPPELYIKIMDYEVGLTYLRWFARNFPDDIGMPVFLFEWTIILFKNGKFKDAEAKAVQTYFANSYLFGKFFGRQITPTEKHENSNQESPEFTNYLHYSSQHEELFDFAEWLTTFEKSEKFELLKNKHSEISERLKQEGNSEIRFSLIRQLQQLEQNGLES